MLDHLSFSQWKAWAACPTAAHAQYVQRAYKPAATEAMAIGKLVELALVGKDFEDLEAGDQALLMTKKGPCVAAQRAVEWGRKAAAMPDVATALQGTEMQAELRPVLGGVPWVCRLDVWDRAGGCVWDVKTTASPLDETWVPRLETRGNFIAALGYGYQLAIYAEAVRQATGDWPGVGIIAIGKHTTRAGEAIPDVWLFDWTDADQLVGYRNALAASCTGPWTCDLGAVLPPIPELYKSPAAGLPRCEQCDWCVANRENRIRQYADPRRTRA